eukprot:1258804-Rhodomonas_salina.4
MADCLPLELWLCHCGVFPPGDGATTCGKAFSTELRVDSKDYLSSNGGGKSGLLLLYHEVLYGLTGPQLLLLRGCSTLSGVLLLPADHHDAAQPEALGQAHLCPLISFKFKIGLATFKACQCPSRRSSFRDPASKPQLVRPSDSES